MADGEKLVSPLACYKAAIWKHFNFKATKNNSGVFETDKSHAICRECNIPVKYSGNSTNLKTHLNRHHRGLDLSHHDDRTDNDLDKKRDSSRPSGNPVAVDKSQPTVIDILSDRKLKPDSKRATEITNLIGRFIVKDLRPFSVVENVGFRALVNNLEPKYRIPCRRHFSTKIIQDMYSENKKALLYDIKQAEYVSITSDGWTSRVTDSYETVTCHYLNDWKLESKVLCTTKFDESHTAENITSFLESVMDEWDICEKTVALVTDNASNMLLAASKLDGITHLPCFAHTLNLAAQKGLKTDGVSRVLSKIRKVVTYFHKSTSATELLRSKQTLLGLPGHKLIKDVTTRWNSTYDMVERYVEQQPAIQATLLSKDIRKKETDLPSLSDSAEEIISIMKPIKTATVVMCGEETPTISIVSPLYHKLLNSFSNPVSERCRAIEIMTSAMKSDFEKRYSGNGVDSFLHKVSALDPRFKALPYLSPVQRDLIFNLVFTEALQQHQINSDVNDDELESEIPTKITRTMQDNNDCALNDLLGDLFTDTDMYDTTKDKEDAVNEEIVNFRRDIVIPMSANPLEWWRKNNANYPILSKLAMKYLSIPATSLPSERVFSTAGDILSAQRSTIKRNHLNALIFLKKKLV
ncbi:hypothetical protein SNE40_020731 [Patella caerulea]|uniref:BED-type domain-containing protein n=1 Tax=Patella caerulea TaxID=87958 RepID=A0AAN8PG78_PATCE